MPSVRAAIYDGDTEAERRWQIRKWSNLVLSNPDMLHVGVLPHHDRWGDVLSNLRTSSSTRRTSTAASSARTSATSCGGCAGLRASTAPTRSSCSPRRRSRTPASSPTSLTGLDVTVVGDDAAPRAERTVALWNPPLSTRSWAMRASALGEASRLMAELVSRGLRTLCFAKSRKSAELIHRFTLDRLGETRRASRPIAPATRPRSAARSSSACRGRAPGRHRHGCARARDRHRPARRVISVGFPGTVASLRQQWGRAGRRGHGLAVLVASEDALDQYFMREPPTLLDRRVRRRSSTTRTRASSTGTSRAAAFEAPVDDADAEILGAEALERAACIPELKPDHGRLCLGGPRLPGGASASAREA